MLVDLKHRSMQRVNRRYALVFSSLCVEHCKQHIAVTVTFGSVSSEDLSQTRRWYLIESRMSGRDDTVHVVVVGGEMGLGMVVVVSCG